MSVITPERAETAKLVMTYLRDRENRTRLRQSGVTPSTPMVGCEWETPFREVRSMLRMHPQADHVLVLIRRGQSIFVMSARTDNPETETVANISFGEVSDASEVGMVYEALEARRSLDQAPTGEHHVIRRPRSSFRLEMALQ